MIIWYIPGNYNVNILVITGWYTLIPVPNTFTGKKLESASSMDQIFIENRFAFLSIMKFVVSEIF